MSDFHWQELDKEYGTKLITGTGDPTAGGITPAVGGSLYLDRNGGAQVSSGAAWVQIIANAMTQSQADARYLQLAGGTLSGRLNAYANVSAGPVLDLFNASTTAGSHVLQARPSVDTNYNFVGLDHTGATITAYIRGDGYASFAGATIAGTAFTQSGIAGLLAGATIPGALTLTSGLAAAAATVTSSYAATSSIATNLIIGAGNGGSPNAVSMSWGDGSGWLLNMGPRIGGAFTPRISFKDTGDITASGIIQSTGTNGFAIGSVSGIPRIMYGSSSSTAFSLLAASNAYADLYLHDVHAQRDATSGTLYFGGDGAAWLYRHSNVLDIHAMHLAFDDTYGMRSQVGNALYSVAPFWVNQSSATSPGGLRFVDVNGTLKGYTYWDGGGFGFLDAAANWAVRVNPTAGTGGQLYGAWSASGNITAPDFVLA